MSNMLTLPATLPARPANMSSTSWLVALADLDPDEVADFAAYMEAVAAGEAREFWPDLAPYRLAEEALCSAS